MDCKKVLKNITVVSTGTIMFMHFMNKYIYHNSLSFDRNHEKDFKTSQHNYEWRSSNINYSVYGSGKPLLLIHDLSVLSSSYEWNAVIEKLSNNWKVYTIDLPGCGKSDKYNFVYTNYFYTQFIQDFINDVIQEEVTLVATGHSAAFSIISYASDDSLIKNMILVNPETVIYERCIPKPLIKAVKYLFTIPVISRFLYNLSVNKKTIENTFYQKYFYSPHKVKKDDILTYFKSSQEGNTHGKYLYSSFLCGFMNYNISKTLSQIQKNISIIVGKSDSYSMENTKLYKEYLPSVKIAAIEHSKYLPQLEVPEKFIEVLEKLL